MSELETLINEALYDPQRPPAVAIAMSAETHLLLARQDERGMYIGCHNGNGPNALHGIPIVNADIPNLATIYYNHGWPKVVPHPAKDTP